LYIYSQEVKEEGDYKMIIENNMTQEQAEHICIEKAQTNAIEKAFGIAIIQGNSTFMQNNKTGEKVETHDVFNSISGTYVAGEWVKDLQTPSVKKVTDADNKVWIEAHVRGIVRKIKTTQVTFTAEPASCEDRKCITMDFNNGQDFYLIFKAPKDGFVAVYVDVPIQDTTYRILPYKQFHSQACVPVKADEEYIFFSKKYDKINSSASLDEMTMTLTDNKTAETNKLFVLYSPEQPFDKPTLGHNKKYWKR